jgi:uncharacterized repeat protein (TIGR03803 family)
MDGAGNLYGTTPNAGSSCDCGVVFRLSPPIAGQTAWTEPVLYSFSGGVDGFGPVAGLTRDHAGNLYGTTDVGGFSNFGGVVFKLSPPAPGRRAWTETVLHSFNGKDGAEPRAGLIRDAAGNLYGTTYAGGAHGSGTVFKLTP